MEQIITVAAIVGLVSGVFFAGMGFLFKKEDAWKTFWLAFAFCGGLALVGGLLGVLDGDGPDYQYGDRPY